jgi:hypothetical protein
VGQKTNKIRAVVLTTYFLMLAGPDCARKVRKFQSFILKKNRSFCIFVPCNRSKGWEAVPMLIISRKKDQKIVLADNIEITILEVGRNRVRFGVKAPKHIPIHTHLKGTEPETVAVGRDPRAQAASSGE